MGCGDYSLSLLNRSERFDLGIWVVFLSTLLAFGYSYE